MGIYTHSKEFFADIIVAVAKKKRTKKRKKPPGARKTGTSKFSGKSNRAKKMAISKLKEIWPSNPDFNFDDEVIKGLDEVAISQLEGNANTDYGILFRLSFLSHWLLKSYLGNTWVKKNFFLDENRKTLANFSEITDFEYHKFLDRAVAFAEMLYNFQDIEGIREKAISLENEDVESALAELEGAQKLFASGRRIKFIVPSNIKTRDYDLETYLEDGTPVACEVKCKFETTEFSATTIRKAVKNGASQLPKGKLGIIILKLPEHWTLNETFKNTVDVGIGNAFRQTKTVSSVIYHWESWERWGGKGARRTMYQEIRANPNARLTDPEIEKLTEPPHTNYRRFIEILGIADIRFEPQY